MSNKNFNNKNTGVNIGNDNTIRGITNKQIKTGNQIDKSNIINNIYPIHQSLTEQQKERDKRQRPYLADKEGQLVKGYGYIVRKYDYENYTVINLTDLNGVYIADHVQLNIKENVYDYKYKSNFIKFEGLSHNYTRSNKSVDYNINITKPIDFLCDNISNCNYNDKFFDIDIDFNKFLNYFYKAEYNNLLRLLNKLTERLNKITIEFGKNFVYNFIINNFMLYNATYDLYNEELQNNKFTYESLISLILIMSSTIFKIETSHTIELKSILSYIAYTCNVEQGIYTYNKTTDGFIKFCQGINIQPNSKRMRKAWSKIILRKYNFGENPNPLNYTKNEISEMAYLLLNDYI